MGTENGVVMCEIDIPQILKADDKSVDLDTEITLLLAGGPHGSNGVGYHGTNKVAASKPVKLSQVQSVGVQKSYLVELHGLLMLVAWIGCAGTGMLIARYFRKTWVGKKFMGLDIWFQAHRTLMILAVFFSILSLILIAVQVGGFSSLEWANVSRGGGTGSHPAVGLATLILAVLNPVMALFRPHPGTPRRNIFNWAHWLVGNSAHVLAIVSIYLASWVAPTLVRESSSATWSWMILAYVVFHVLVHLALSILWANAETKGNKEQDHVMRDLGMPGTKDPNSNGDASFSAYRRILLIIYSVTVFIVVVVLITGIFNQF